jgi:hypothetical protein
MAFGKGTIDSAGGAVSDLFAAKAYKYKAQGAAFEKENYELASQLALKNKQFTEMATRIKASQQDRDLFKSLGQTRADIAGAGFAESGSALDILRESAQQGALTRAVTEQQGLITGEGYEQEAKSYQNMAQAAQVAIDAANEAATGSYISAGFKAISSVASIFS